MEALWKFDQDAFRAIQSLRTGWLDPIVQAITITGLGWVQILLIAALFVNWKSVKKGSWSRQGLAFPLALAYALSGLVNAIVKHSLERERPSNFAWVNSLEQVHYSSFSSGHTATSFGIAGLLFWMTRGTERQAWGRWAMAWAFAVGFSRMYVGVHWLSDVISGGLVGFTCSSWLAWFLLRKPKIEATAV